MNPLEVVFWVATTLIVYAAIGYPLAVLLLARVFGRTASGEDMTPFVSIIITAYNEEQHIGAKLGNTLALDYPADRFEVIVGSDASSDRTDAIAASYAARGVRLAAQARRVGKTLTQRAAVALASGDVLVFSDATSTCRPDALRRIVRGFADPNVGCVAGQLVYHDPSSTAVGLGCRLYWAYEKIIRRPRAGSAPLSA